MKYYVYLIVTAYLVLFGPLFVIVATSATNMLPAAIYRAHRGLQYLANIVMFLIGGLVASFIGIATGGLSGLGWGGYFIPMTLVSSALLFATNAFIVAIALSKGNFQGYSRRQVFILLAIAYATCLTFIISDVWQGVFKFPG